ncbi:unnamed protein product [Parnassius mnemosyne]|uniref:Uncharacterized protein n=1 Tax=Parnassius mnemosyne TaxID=213953 RepID=A0AAV1L9M9_9NEOP
MAHLRKPRLSRILEAMESKKDSVSTENPKLISMDDLDYNFSRDANPITVDTCRSPSLLQEQALPQSVSHTMEADVQPVDDGIPNPYLSGTGFQELTPEEGLTRPGPSSRARSNSTSSKSSSSSSSTSSSSSSSSSASESDKDFSPDEADYDADYVPATPPRRVLFSPTPQNSISVQLVEENNLGPPEQNRTPNKRRRKGFPKASVRQDAKRLLHSSNRGPKHSFSFEINNIKHRICKTFFKNTLAINNRPIATVIAKKNQAGTIEKEKRGKHGKQYKISSDIIKGIKNHIDSIPRIESHYVRQQTTREFIDGGKNLTDLYTDYQTQCLSDGVEAAKIHTYRKVFNEDYNIGFHTPKKDQCELCISFKNAVDKTIELQNRYDQHQLEKELCRQEKSNDKTMVKENYIVACYDLQAVLPLPKGDVSTLYYKCKLNVCNFTISELAKDYCDCFVWSEVEALRGANEIATCVWKYLTKRASEINDNNLRITFYSDNCCVGTHKTVIEKAVKKCLRSGPVYTPDQYVTIIRTTRKKGNPYNVTEMCYSDFVDIKNLTAICGAQFSKNTEGETVKMSDIKIMKFEKHQDFNHVGIYYKTSYSDTDFKEIQFRNNRSSRTRTSTDLQDFQLKPLYQSRLKLSDRKNSDLKSLINNNILPQSYALSYYNSILF